jgi:hypothetical protein
MNKNEKISLCACAFITTLLLSIFTYQRVCDAIYIHKMIEIDKQHKNNGGN